MSRKDRRAKYQKDYKEPVKEKIGSDGIPNVDFLDVTFPSRWQELLPEWEELTEEEKRGRTPFCEALQKLFFRGGKLSDYGIVPKPGINVGRVTQYVAATLGDWGPKHEHKIGGIGHMLAKWCEVTTK